MIGLEYLALCAPNVAPETVQQIIRVESSGDLLALNVNGATLDRKPVDAADAAALARQYIEAGYSVDLGLMQVNSRNVARLGYSIEDMFEPCKNIAAGAAVLTEFYRSAKPKHADAQTALRAALSAYNTGSFTRGFNNGYVGRYFGPAASSLTPAAITLTVNPYTAGTAVFIRQEQEAMSDTSNTPRTDPVLSQELDDAGTPGVQVQVDAATAEENGAFEETAISEADAWDSNADLPDDQAPDPHATAIVTGGVVMAPARSGMSATPGEAPGSTGLNGANPVQLTREDGHEE